MKTELFPDLRILPKALNADGQWDSVVERWCFGLAQYPGEINTRLVHFAVREMRGDLQEAIEACCVIDVLDTALQLSRAAKYLVDEREIAYQILQTLPDPTALNEEQQFTLCQIVDQVENAYGDAISFMRWRESERA
jgi:hypothetical protein